MGRELYATEPTFRATLDRCDAILQECLGRSLLELLYPETAPEHNDLMESHPCGQAANFALECALADLWRFTPELFEDDAVDRAVSADGFGTAWSSLQADWTAEMEGLMAEAGLTVPAPLVFRSTGRVGRHTEHMGFLLATMQHLQRSYPGAVW